VSVQLATFDRAGGPAGPARLPRGSFDIPFAEAIAWALARQAVLPGEFYGARLQAIRARSFSIAGLAALDQLQEVADSLARATASGQTFQDWQRALATKGPDAFSLGRARRELIFRNAVQTHYGIGRTIQQRENAAARGYLMWDAINDSRTRPTHRAMDGHIAPIDDPIWRRWSPPAGHRCFLPGTRIRGDFQIGLQTRYAGPAVEVLTRSGARLSVTGNHPVLTRRGWIAAQDLQVGDDLLRHGRVIDAASLPVEDDDDLPPKAEEVFAALARQALGTADLAAFDLHGDAKFGEGEVHIAGADGILVKGFQSVSAERQKQGQLVAADDGATWGVLHAFGSSVCRAISAAVLGNQALDVSRGSAKGVCDHAGAERGSSVQRHRRSFQGFVFGISGAPRGGALALDGGAVGLHLCPLDPLGSASPANLRAVPQQQGTHGGPRDAGLSSDGLFARAAGVLRQKLRHVLGLTSRPGLGPCPPDGQAVLSRAALDAGIAQQTTEQAVAHGGLFQALSHGFPSDVCADQVVGVRHFTFRGHVYDFETKQGWLAADGVIVSNCRCTRIALTEAQARARGYPKAAPAVEPDKGWEGDPTEGNDDLVRIIQARQDSCGVTFAARRTRARGLWCDEGNARTLLDAAKQALVENRAAMRNPDALPDASQAVIPQDKLVQYSLNPDHPVGGEKARLFASRLGITVDNWKTLRDQILAQLSTLPAASRGIDVWGERFQVDVPIIGPAGSGTVRTGWVVDAPGDAPRLVSAYVLKGR